MFIKSGLFSKKIFDLKSQILNSYYFIDALFIIYIYSLLTISLNSYRAEYLIFAAFVQSKIQSFGIVPLKINQLYLK